MAVRYVETRTPIVTKQEIIEINNGILRQITGGAFELGAGAALLIGGLVYDGYIPVYPLLAIGVIGTGVIIRGIARTLAGGFMLISPRLPERVHIEEADEPQAEEPTDADSILAYVGGSETPIQIPRTRQRKAAGGYTFRGKLLDALEAQAREGDSITRQPLLDARLITTREYGDMVGALIRAGYAEPNGRGNVWTDAGRDWVMDDRPTLSAS